MQECSRLSQSSKLKEGNFVKLNDLAYLSYPGKTDLPKT